MGLKAPLSAIMGAYLHTYQRHPAIQCIIVIKMKRREEPRMKNL